MEILVCIIAFLEILIVVYLIEVHKYLEAVNEELDLIENTLDNCKKKNK